MRLLLMSMFFACITNISLAEQGFTPKDTTYKNIFIPLIEQDAKEEEKEGYSKAYYVHGFTYIISFLPLEKIDTYCLFIFYTGIDKNKIDWGNSDYKITFNTDGSIRKIEKDNKSLILHGNSISTFSTSFSPPLNPREGKILKDALVLDVQKHLGQLTMHLTKVQKKDGVPVETKTQK